MFKYVGYMIRIFSFFGLFSIFCFNGCNGNPIIDQDNNSTKGVMVEGDRIIAVNTFGELTITSGKGNSRYLTLSGKDRSVVWAGDTVCVKLTKGEIKDTKLPLTGLRCNTNVKRLRYKEGGGPTRVKMIESQIYFDNLKAFEDWLGPKYDEWYNPRMWSTNGLYVYWNHVTPEYWIFPKQSYLYIELFQIYVGGKIPSNLPDAQDDKIKTVHLTDKQLKEFIQSIN